MREIYNKIDRVLKRHQNVSTYLGKLTDKQVIQIKKKYSEYDIEKGYFGYYSFKKK